MAPLILADIEHRKRCLTDFETIFSVEAAAGTGKTSLLAGRVVMLLANGCPPSQIAAITYTELAAGELARRIQHTIERLVAGKIPPELVCCFPDGIDPISLANLQSAHRDLDGVTITTIHGFCKVIIGDHAVAAGMDPGMTVADENVAANLMDDAFASWLKSTLDGEAEEGEPIAEMCRRDPRGTVSILRAIVDLRREHKTARVIPINADARPDLELCHAIDLFCRWVAANPEDSWTRGLAEQCGPLRGYYEDSFAASPDFRRLWDLTTPPRLSCMQKDTVRFAEYKGEASWKRLLGEELGAAKSAEAKVLIAGIEQALASLLGEVGIRLVQTVSSALDGVFDRYEQAKAKAAVLDFNDLLIHAHQLVTGDGLVRTAVAERFRRILVDEFQDTDPIQCAILFAVAAAEGSDIGLGASLRSGSLFLVGDPKQAIYRFRGADIATYTRARQAVIGLANGASIEIVSNFRSAPAILDFVNDRFSHVFVPPSQPDYVALSATRAATTDVMSVVRITLGPEAERVSAGATRDFEAERVAQLCNELVSGFMITGHDGERRLARPGDIALLAPGHTELWRYERALEAEGLQIASQASKALTRRQETQDVLALMRTLSDSSDRLAFGALLRGPLVGLTDQELLDITAALNANGGTRQYFDITTNSELVSNPYARSILDALQALRRRRHSLTPAVLLAEAVEVLSVRLVLASRYKSKNAQALANVDALIERARRFSISGVDRFIEDLQGRWDRLEQMVEGRIDASEEAIHLVSMHSCKGLEWPIVIPINSVTRFRSPGQLVHRRSDNTLHWVLAGIVPPHLEDAMRDEAEGEARERERLMYVACTRARDLLVLAEPPTRDALTWTSAVDLRISQLPLMTPVPNAGEKAAPAPIANSQTKAVFEAEALAVANAAEVVAWRQPSSHDPDHFIPAISAPSDLGAFVISEMPVGIGLDRGSLLHKLMEEVLTGELVLDERALSHRSSTLIGQLRALNGESGKPAPLPDELALTVLQTFSMPEIEALRHYLVPEVSVWGSDSAAALVSGRADCLIVRDDEILGVIDWKSDVSPTRAIVDSYVDQVRQYMAMVGVEVGMLCFMSHRSVVWIGPRESLYDSLRIKITD